MSKGRTDEVCADACSFTHNLPDGRGAVATYVLNIW